MRLAGLHRSLSLRERGRQYLERGELVMLADADLESSLGATEVEDEERAALALHRQCSLEQVTIEVLIKRHEDSLSGPVKADNRAGQPAVANRLLAPSRRIERAARYSNDGASRTPASAMFARIW